MEKELEQLEKVNKENEMEIVRINEKLDNLKKEKDELVKSITDMGIDVDEAEMILETSEDELKTKIAEAKKVLGVE